MSRQQATSQFGRRPFMSSTLSLGRSKTVSPSHQYKPARHRSWCQSPGSSSHAMHLCVTLQSVSRHTHTALPSLIHEPSSNANQTGQHPRTCFGVERSFLGAVTFDARPTSNNILQSCYQPPQQRNPSGSALCWADWAEFVTDVHSGENPGIRLYPP